MTHQERTKPYKIGDEYISADKVWIVTDVFDGGYKSKLKEESETKNVSTYPNEMLTDYLVK